MNRINLFGTLPFCFLLFSCADPKPIALDIEAAPPPSKAVNSAFGGKIGVNVTQWVGGSLSDPSKGKISHFTFNEERFYRNGVARYLNRHLSNWTVDVSNRDATLSLSCKAVNLGRTNCADTSYQCSLKDKSKTVSTFEKVLPSETCLITTPANYQTQSINHALQLGSSIVDGIVKYEGLEETIAKRNREKLEQELQEARKREERLEIQERKKKRSQQTAKSGSPVRESRNTANDVTQKTQRKAREASASRPVRNTSPAKAVGNLLTCDIPSQNVCGEYSFRSSRDLENFSRSCRSGGAVVTKGEHICSATVGYCLHTAGGRQTKTYAYGRVQTTVARNCEATGGTYKRG